MPPAVRIAPITVKCRELRPFCGLRVESADWSKEITSRCLTTWMLFRMVFYSNANNKTG